MRTTRSMRVRLAVIFTGISLVVAALIGLIAYREVRSTEAAAATSRLERVTKQIADILSLSVSQLGARTAPLAHDSVLVSYMRSPSPRTQPAARRRLRETAAQAAQPAYIDLFDVERRRVLSEPDSIVPPGARNARDAIGSLPARDSVGVGPVFTVDGAVLFALVVRLVDRGTTIGYVVERRPVTNTPQGLEQIRGLIGPEARILFGNARGDLWTDMSAPISTPALNPGLQPGTLQYTRDSAGPVLAKIHAVPGTPWALIVEFPERDLFSRARAFRWNLALWSLLLIGIVTTCVWFLAGRIARPVADLASVADAMRTGEYSIRARAARRDEIGTLGHAFNTMAVNIATAQDALQQKVAELERSEARLQRVVASSGAVIFELTFVGDAVELEWISENISALLGYTATEAHAPSWWSTNVHPDDRKSLGTRPHRSSYHDGANEYRFRHKDGTYRWLREEQRLMRDTDGSAVGVIGAWIDITDRRQLEEQFRQAQKMEAIGRLAGGVAHDFNNLLTVILGESAAVLADGRVIDAEAARAVEEIRKAADRAAMLTRQLLAFSRRQLIEPSTLELNDVVTGVESMLTRLIGEDVTLTLQLGAYVGDVKADRGQLEQVLVNLVVNARDAMPDGGHITIETKNVELGEHYAETHSDVVPGRYALVSVTDSGSGMDEATQSHLFEPFFTTKEPGKGTGLGLATSYAIVKQIGGHISAYSEVGIGTTMHVYLPRTDAAGLAPVRTSGKVQVRGDETVLVVEDEAQVRRITNRILKNLGYTVLEAANGEEALAVLDKHEGPVHLLLSDVVLPRMNGPALMEHVRRRRPDIHVLFVSGYSDNVTLRSKLLDHEVMLLQKPFTQASLARKVREALDAAPTPT